MIRTRNRTRAAVLLLALGATAWLGCATGTDSLSLTALEPASALAGMGSLTLTLRGAGFASGDEVAWNGAARAATFVSAEELTVTLTAADLATAGTAMVAVRRASSDATGPGNESESLEFEILPVTAVSTHAAAESPVLPDGVVPIRHDESFQLTLVGASDGEEFDVTADATWTTDDAAVADVADGLVTPVAPGDVTISATFSGMTSSLMLAVVDPSTLAFEPATLNIALGDTIVLAMKVMPTPGPALSGAGPALTGPNLTRDYISATNVVSENPDIVEVPSAEDIVNGLPPGRAIALGVGAVRIRGEVLGTNVYLDGMVTEGGTGGDEYLGAGAAGGPTVDLFKFDTNAQDLTSVGSASFSPRTDAIISGDTWGVGLTGTAIRQYSLSAADGSWNEAASLSLSSTAGARDLSSLPASAYLTCFINSYTSTVPCYAKVGSEMQDAPTPDSLPAGLVRGLAMGVDADDIPHLAAVIGTQNVVAIGSGSGTSISWTPWRPYDSDIGAAGIQAMPDEQTFVLYGAGAQALRFANGTPTLGNYATASFTMQEVAGVGNHVVGPKLNTNEMACWELGANLQLTDKVTTTLSDLQYIDGVVGSRVSEDRLYLAGVNMDGGGVVGAFAVEPTTCELTQLGQYHTLTADGFHLVAAYRGN